VGKVITIFQLRLLDRVKKKGKHRGGAKGGNKGHFHKWGRSQQGFDRLGHREKLTTETSSIRCLQGRVWDTV